MAVIEARGLSLDFPYYHIGARSLKKRLMGKSRLHKDPSNRIVVTALRNLNFRIDTGERVALVGPNGAGKTTLLRTFAGVYEPVAGSLTVTGQVGALIDVAAGMDMDSTGRENVRLRGLYRGLTDAECDILAEEVAEFAGLGDFFDVPIRTFSAGMSVRLAFAMATALQPQVLLMDEWFLAGDAAFMARAEERLARLVGGADIMVVATHDYAVVRRWCNRAIRLEGGTVVADGPVEQVLAGLEASG